MDEKELRKALEIHLDTLRRNLESRIAGSAENKVPKNLMKNCGGKSAKRPPNTPVM